MRQFSSEGFMLVGKNSNRRIIKSFIDTVLYNCSISVVG